MKDENAGSGRFYPQRPVPAAGAVVVHGGKLLLVRRANAPSEGLWSFPGGAIEIGETVYEAAARETREETGVEIEPYDVACVVDAITRDDQGRVRYHYVIIDVYARYLGGRPKAASDGAAARWVAAEELKTLDLTPTALPWAKKALGIED
jgi:ADP-ribose pyrophosphatase YjhB (NUDIX family)